MKSNLVQDDEARPATERVVDPPVPLWIVAELKEGNVRRRI